MRFYFRKFWDEHPRFRKVAGVTLVIIGLASIITPFTPVGFLLIIGMELLGVRLLFWDKIKDWLKRKNNAKNG